MRFAFAHKLSTYLMVTCAFGSVAMGGFLGDLWVLASLIGFIVSWFWEPPRIDFDRWNKPWTALAVLVLAYSAFNVLAGRDILLVGTEFLMFLCAVKLFNRRQCKDYQQIYVLAFLMLTAGTVLNYELTYGVFFVGFVVSSTWALILFHLRREMEDNFLLKHADGRPTQRVEVSRILNSRRIVGGRFFAGSAAVSLLIFIFSSLLFFMIPRIGFGFFFQKDRTAMQMAGFADGVRLGGHGVIKDNRTVVMRVKVDDALEGTRAPTIHWRGVAFDSYKGGAWLRSEHAPRANQNVVWADGVSRHHMTYEKLENDPVRLHRRMEAAARQEIYLEPMGNDVLFGAAMPMTFELGRLAGRGRAFSGRNDELRLRHSQGIKYTVYSQIAPPDPAALRAATDAFVPTGYEVYTRYPENEITRETAALAARITAGLDNNYDKARAVERWLQTNLGYTLEMKSPGDTEPIHFFLFDRKMGHCEYFSSAMAIMLRTLGIPTRNVNGFLGGEWNEYDDYIAVRAGDAHSWVEVYFPGHGWVTFDPTPAGDGMERGSGWTDKMQRWFDNLRFKWFKWVIEYDLYQQLSVFRAIGDKLEGGRDGASGALAAVKDWARRHKATAIGVGVAVVLVIIGYALWRRRREAARGTSATGERRGKRKAVAALYNGVLDFLRRKGHPRPPARTPREHARALLGAGVPGAEAFAELTELYYGAEYGDADVRDLDRAEALSARVRAAFAEARKHRAA